MTHSDAELVRVFRAELLLARRRAQHDELRGTAGQTPAQAKDPQNYR